METINVIGLGYIGLPTALMLVENGYQVVGTDINEPLVQSYINGDFQSNEKGINELFEKALQKGMRFLTECISTSIYIISVPTPYITIDKKIDPTFLLNAVQSIMNVCKNEAIIIIESTISPGTIDKHIRPIIEQKCEKDEIQLHIAHAPERIIPGNIIGELTQTPRTIGVDSEEIGTKLLQIYSSFCKGKIVITNIRTAEMTKVIENTYRDINIAFANELAKICNYEDMDVYEVIRIANNHPRVNILRPGPGVGGHCISVDPWFLVGDYPELAKVISAARKVNDSMPRYVIKRVSTIMKEHSINNIGDVGIYGLTYKENVDDVRESPALQITRFLEQHLSYGIKAYDPFIKREIVSNQFFDFELFLKDIKIVVILVAHTHIKENKEWLKNKVVYDTQNIGCTARYLYTL